MILQKAAEILTLSNIRHWILKQLKKDKQMDEGNSKLELIFDSIEDYAIFTIDLKNRITDWNVGGERLFGYKAEEIVGEDVSLLFLPEDRAAGIPDQKIKTVFETGVTIDERWLLRKDGGRFFASGTTRPLKDAEGNISGFIRVTRDITERRESADRLTRLLFCEQAARKEAERANELKLQFLAIISHELKTPLTSIKGFASTLTSADLEWDEASQQQFISIIESESVVR